MRAAKFAIVPVVLLIAACVGGTDAQRKESQQAVEAAIDSPENWATKAENYEDLSLRWLESFDDPVMLKFIEEGKANNLDLQAAAGNMDRAWLLAEQSGAALKPTVDLSLGRTQTGRANSGSSSSDVNVGLTVSWEADVWGRIRAGVSAAEASAQAAEADYVFAQHSLSSNIARTYLQVIEAKLQAGITRKNLSILGETMRIAQVKFDNGVSSGQDIALNRANLASARDQLTAIEGSQRDATRALEVLLGRYPDAALEMPDVLPKLPPPPPAGVPSEVLERRPDIVSAERRVASAFNATAQAEAARLPSFSLTTSAGGGSSSLSDVLDPANVAWKLAANLVAPLFDGGRRRIDVEIANVEQRQAIASYAQTALSAFAEVETNLDLGRVLASRRGDLTEAMEQSQKAYRIAELRYEEGETELLDTLQIQQQAISAESNLLSIQRLQLDQRIVLYLSLGGEW
jgi:NodT family efflux transporter outer membrane factor (OMF) lipoprotein